MDAKQKEGLSGGMMRKMTQNLVRSAKHKQSRLEEKSIQSITKIFNQMPLGFAINLPWLNRPLVIKNPQTLFNDQRIATGWGQLNLGT